MTYALTLTATFATSIAFAGAWFVRSLDPLGRPTEDETVAA